VASYHRLATLWDVDNLAVVGCHTARAWTVADECDLGRTSMDAPQTVLKTAGLTSAVVHNWPPAFGIEPENSLDVRSHPQSVAGLAVILAVR
jgi:hypothetical protein